MYCWSATSRWWGPLIGALEHGHQQQPAAMSTASLAELEGDWPLAGLMTLKGSAPPVNYPGKPIRQLAFLSVAAVDGPLLALPQSNQAGSSG